MRYCPPPVLLLLQTIGLLLIFMACQQAQNEGVPKESDSDGVQIIPDDLEKSPFSFLITDLDRLTEGTPLQIIIWNPDQDYVISDEFVNELRNSVVIEKVGGERVFFDVAIRNSSTEQTLPLEEPHATVVLEWSEPLEMGVWYVAYFLEIPTQLVAPSLSQPSSHGVYAVRFYQGSLPTVRTIFLCEGESKVYGEVSLSETVLRSESELSTKLAIKGSSGIPCRFVRSRPEHTLFSKASFECDGEPLGQKWEFTLAPGLVSPEGQPLGVFPRETAYSTQLEFKDMALRANSPECRVWFPESESGVPTAPDSSYEDSVSMAILEEKLSPFEVTIKKQGVECDSCKHRVTFVNLDQVTHQIVFESADVAPSPIIRPGATWTTTTFANTGSYSFSDPSSPSKLNGIIHVVDQ